MRCSVLHYRLLHPSETSPRHALPESLDCSVRTDGDSGARAAEPVVLPKVSSDTLSKQHVTLPADFHTDRNLLLLYFDLTQQPDVDSWNTVIDRWRANDPSLTAYTSLVSSQKNFLSRWWQNSSMRSAAPDSSRWPTTLPLYVDKHAFDRQLGFRRRSKWCCCCSIARATCLSRVSGPPNDSSRAAMSAALNAAGVTGRKPARRQRRPRTDHRYVKFNRPNPAPSAYTNASVPSA